MYQAVAYKTSQLLEKHKAIMHIFISFLLLKSGN